MTPDEIVNRLDNDAVHELACLLGELERHIAEDTGLLDWIESAAGCDLGKQRDGYESVLDLLGQVADKLGDKITGGIDPPQPHTMQDVFLQRGGKRWEKNGLTRIYITAAVFNELKGTGFRDSTNKFFFDCNTNAVMRAYRNNKPICEIQY